MKKFLISLLFVFYFTQLFAQTTYTGALVNTDPTFNRPEEGIPPTSLSAYTNVYYNVLSYNVTATGLATFTTNSTWDNFLILYNQSGFFPVTPLTNALIASDDFIGINAGFSYNFTSTGLYYIVICSYKNNIKGAYSVTVDAGTILPLQLLSFKAEKRTTNSNLIKWTSAEETNLLAYQVQRSDDNIHFIDVENGNITPANNTTATSYSFIDLHPGLGNQYYRLKMIEKSGSKSYSSVAVVKKGATSILSMNVYPNPATDFLEIEMKSMQYKNVGISIINEEGKLLYSGQNIFNGQAHLSINIQELPVGQYFVKMICNNEEYSTQFIKK
jgi:hypothetical protein